MNRSRPRKRISSGWRESRVAKRDFEVRGWRGKRGGWCSVVGSIFGVLSFVTGESSTVP